MVRCPSCSRPLDPQMIVCPSCQQYADWTNEMERKAARRRKRRIVAPILSAIMPGLGQFSQNRVGAGLFFLFLPVALAGLTQLLWKEMNWGVYFLIGVVPLLWLANILDAIFSYKSLRAPCQKLCPIHLDVPGYQALISQGRFREAYALIRQKLPLVGVCGRICIAPCQSKCSPWLREHMAIRDLKRFVADVERKAGGRGTQAASRPTASVGKIAVVGAGPAGLTAAYFLAREGANVTVLEATESAGGMLRYAIPRYRLPLPILEEEIRDILSTGISLQTGVHVGKTITVKDLLADGNRAVFMATGAPQSSPLRIPGEDKQGVLMGLDFLRAVNIGRPPSLASTVVVVGGGNVAIDAARTALRLGAPKVVIAYRRTLDEMPANPDEIEEARKEGIAIMFLVGPQSVAGKEKVEGIELIRMALGKPDATGRRRPIPIEASEFVFPCSHIIVAIGQRPDATVYAGLEGVPVRRDGTLVVNRRGRVKGKIPGLYAGGDLSRGPASFIEAVADGRQAYFSIMRQLGRKVSFPGDWEIDAAPSWNPNRGSSRVACTMIPMRKRISSFSEVQIGYSWEESIREAKRCLRCNKGY